MSSQPKWSLSDDKSDAIVDFPTSPPTQFRLKADDVEELIATLGRIRLDMLPAAMPSDPDVGTRIAIPNDSRWYLDPRTDGSLLLTIFHPAFRWVGAVVAAADLSRFIDIASKAKPSS